MRRRREPDAEEQRTVVQELYWSVHVTWVGNGRSWEVGTQKEAMTIRDRITKATGDFVEISRGYFVRVDQITSFTIVPYERTRDAETGDAIGWAEQATVEGWNG